MQSLERGDDLAHDRLSSQAGEPRTVDGGDTSGKLLEGLKKRA